jgi:hypothetical protein
MTVDSRKLSMKVEIGHHQTCTFMHTFPKNKSSQLTQPEKAESVYNILQHHGEVIL